MPTISTSRRGSLGGQLGTGSYYSLLLLLAWLARQLTFSALFPSFAVVFSFCITAGTHTAKFIKNLVFSDFSYEKLSIYQIMQ